jgi:hypothetical protein
VHGVCSSKIVHCVCSSKIVHGVCSSKIVHGVCSSTIVHGVCSIKIVHGVCSSNMHRTTALQMAEALRRKVALPLVRLDRFLADDVVHPVRSRRVS